MAASTACPASKSERAPFGSAEKMTVRMMKMSTTCSVHKILFNFFASWKMERFLPKTQPPVAEKGQNIRMYVVH